MVLAVTGHRPTKVGGYSDAAFAKLVHLAELVIPPLAPSRVLTGMALGWDQAVAQACINLKIPFTGCLPCAGQDSQWPLQSRLQWQRLLRDPLCTTHHCSTGAYAPWLMQARNEYMVQHSDHLLALWDGSSGGTANCVHYAQRLSPPRPITNCWSTFSTMK